MIRTNGRDYRAVGPVHGTLGRNVARTPGVVNGTIGPLSWAISKLVRTRSRFDREA